MINDLNFNHLYYFHVICAEGSLGGASKKLNVSQPTLSQQLKLFEENTGQELFNRAGRALKLNSNGEFIYDYTKKIFDLAEEMYSGLSYRKQLNVDYQLKVGITPSVSRSYAARLLKPIFIDESIGLLTSEANFETLVDKLYSLELDFILSESPNKHIVTKGIDVCEVKQPKYLVVGGENFEDLGDEKDFLQKLNEKPYFKYTSSNELQREIDRYFFKNDVRPKVVGESDDLSIMIAATELNHCFSIVPDVSVIHLIKDGRIKKLAEFYNHASKICALFLEDNSSEKVKAIVNKIKKQF